MLLRALLARELGGKKSKIYRPDLATCRTTCIRAVCVCTLRNGFSLIGYRDRLAAARLMHRCNRTRAAATQWLSLFA